MRATTAGLRTPAVVSHGSPAAPHGLPLWRVPLEKVHVTRRPPGRSADGGVEYGRLLVPGQVPGDVVLAEARREDALRDEVWGVVRWVWADLEAPADLVSRVGRALERGAR